MAIRDKNDLIAAIFVDWNEKLRQGNARTSYYYRYKLEKNNEAVQAILDDNKKQRQLEDTVRSLVEKLDNGEIFAVDYSEFKSALGKEFKITSKHMALRLLYMAYDIYKGISSEQYIKIFMALRRADTDGSLDGSKKNKTAGLLIFYEWYIQLLSSKYPELAGKIGSFDEAAEWLIKTGVVESYEYECLVGLIRDHFTNNGIRERQAADTGEVEKTMEMVRKKKYKYNEDIALLTGFYEYQGLNLEDMGVNGNPEAIVCRNAFFDWDRWHKIYLEMRRRKEYEGCMLPLYISPETGTGIYIIGRKYSINYLFYGYLGNSFVAGTSCFVCIISFNENDSMSPMEYKETVREDIKCRGVKALLVRAIEKIGNSKKQYARNSGLYVEVFDSMSDVRKRYENMQSNPDEEIGLFTGNNSPIIPESVTGTVYEKYFDPSLRGINLEDDENREEIKEEYLKKENAGIRRESISKEKRAEALAAKNRIAGSGLNMG